MIEIVDFANGVALAFGLLLGFFARDKRVFRAFLVIAGLMVFPISFDWFDSTPAAIICIGFIDIIAALLFYRFCGSLISALMALVILAQISTNAVMIYDYYHDTDLIWSAYQLINAKLTALQIGLLFVVGGGHIFVPSNTGGVGAGGRELSS